VSARGPSGKYRWSAFTHWLNLAFLGAAGVAGAIYDPAIWLVVAPLEAGAMWVVPDLPSFRAAVDAAGDADRHHQERAYYMDQLWGLRPAKRVGLLKRLLTDVEPEPLEVRVIGRDDPAFRLYTELHEIMGKLRELQGVRSVSIPAPAFERLDRVITGYLRMVVAYRALARALRGLDETQLQRDLAEVEAKLVGARPELRSVLLERKRLCEARLERLPRLHATLELYKTRADAVVYQLRNLHGQVLADPGTDVTGFLDDLVERQEILADPLAELEADRTVREMLRPRASTGNKG
jgi:hypothetical protein